MEISKHIDAKGITDEKRWDKLVRNSLYPSFRQNYPYVINRNKTRRNTYPYIFIEDGNDVAGVQYSIVKSKYNLLSAADIIPGFIFRNEPSQALLEFIIEHFLSWTREQKASYSRIHPWLPQSIADKETPYQQFFNEVLTHYGFEAIKEGPHTYWLDLSLSEDDLLKRMTRKTRYEVRQGLKSDIQITCIEDPDREIIEQFWDLYKLLGENKGFRLYPEQKFKEELFLLLETGIAVLFVATYLDTIINMSIASNFGIVSYLHGAINPEFKKLEGCPSPGQLAQWSMITEMKKRDAHMYDMGFCPGPIPDNSHPAYNIWRFKYGFGGTHVQFLPTYGKILHPVKGRFFRYLKKT